MIFFKRHNRTFAAKMTFILCTSILLVFVAVYSLTLYQIAEDLIEKERESASEKVSLYSSRVQDVLTSMEMNVWSHEIAVKQNLNDTAAISRILHGMMERDSNMVYAFVCIEPNYKNFGEDGAMYNVIRQKDNSGVFGKRSSTYRFSTFPYYLVPTRKNCDYWTNPFKATNGDKVSAFAHPLVDNEGHTFGVIGADIGLKRITRDFVAMNQREDANSEIFLFGKDGRYLVSADGEKIVNETFITDARENSSDDLEAVGRDMMAGNKGTAEIKYKGKKYLISYDIIPKLGWGIAFCKPFDIIYQKMMYGVLFTIALLLVSIAVIAYLVTLIVRRRTKPIHDYAKSAIKIAEGDFDTPVNKATSGDEIQQLGDSLDNMRKSLKDYMQKLTETTAARQSIEKELSIAHDIQMGMLPHVFPEPSEHNNVDIFAFLQPAKEVGGDLYDFLIKDNKLHFIIGDVSGKGIPASLVMAITNSVFNAELQSASSPVNVVENLNNAIAKNNDRNMFVTLIVGELDLRNGNLRICNAGHDPMLLVRGDKAQKMEMTKNLPVGLLEDFPYQMNEYNLLAEDKLVLYTDGVSEAENPEKQLYTIDRLVGVVEQNAHLSSRGIIEAISNDVRTFANGADQSDDITIMSIQVGSINSLC